MELGEQRLDEAQLRNMSTVELVRHAMTEMKLLIRAEMLHARMELRAELKEARNAGILIGMALFLAPAGLAIALMAIVLGLPIAQWLSALVLGRHRARGRRTSRVPRGEEAAQAASGEDPGPPEARLDADPGGPPVSADPQPQVEQTADRLRDEFLVTLRELDRRRHRAMDVRGLMRDNRRVLIAAGAGLAAVILVVVGTTVALSRSRRARLPSRRMQGLRRAWENPDRLASRPEDSAPLGLLSSLLKIAVVAAGSQLIRRTVQRALPAGS